MNKSVQISEYGASFHCDTEFFYKLILCINNNIIPVQLCVALRCIYRNIDQKIAKGNLYTPHINMECLRESEYKINKNVFLI